MPIPNFLFLREQPERADFFQLNSNSALGQARTLSARPCPGIGPSFFAAIGGIALSFWSAAPMVKDGGSGTMWRRLPD
jgi:hypothetical protein